MLVGRFFAGITALTGLLLAQGGPPDIRILGARPGRPAPLVKGAPFSADIVTETTQILADGNRIRQSTTERVYRDGEGRTRRETSLAGLSGAPPSNRPQLAFIDDPVAGTSYALDLTNRTVTRSERRGPERDFAGRNRPARGGLRPGFVRPDQLARSGRPRPDVKAESLGRQVIAGVPADGSRTTQTIAAGEIGNALPIQIVTENWYSPDLQMEVLSKRSDPRSGDTVMQMTNVVRAEPPASLFTLPTDFQAAPVEPRMRRAKAQ
jgi:hypothetical protein